MIEQLSDIIVNLDELLSELEGGHPDLGEIERLAEEAREAVQALFDEVGDEEDADDEGGEDRALDLEDEDEDEDEDVSDR